MHTSCLCSVFVFNASAFILDIFLSDMPITWSGLLPSAHRQCMWYSVQIRIPFSSGKIACKLDTCTHLSQSEIKKDCCLFVLPEKKMSSNLGHSSQYKFTLKTSNVQFKTLPIACSSKRRNGNSPPIFHPGKNAGPGVRRPKVKVISADNQLFWAHYLSSLSLTFFIYKMKVYMNFYTFLYTS